MTDTVLGGAVELLQDFGFFDVILPFLLVFTIVFGILEKTKIFGTENYKGQEIAKKNINAMVAFVIAFFVISAKEVVASFQISLPKIALFLVAIVCFLMLVGAFVSSKEGFDFSNLYKGYMGIFVAVFLVSVISIFLDSFGLLTPIYDYISGKGANVFITVVFVGIVAAVVFFVLGSNSEGSK